MGKLLAVSRMSSSALRSQVQRELIDLSSPYLGEYTAVERRGKARKALECFDELMLRGEQLTLRAQTWKT